MQDTESQFRSPENPHDVASARLGVVNSAVSWIMDVLSPTVAQDAAPIGNWTTTTTRPETLNNDRMSVLFMNHSQKARYYAAQLAVEGSGASSQPAPINADVIAREMDRIGDVATEPDLLAARTQQSRADVARDVIAEIHDPQAIAHTGDSHEYSLGA